MLQEAESILNYVRGDIELPRLSRLAADISKQAANEVSDQAEEAVPDDCESDVVGGMIFLTHMVSALVAMYGREAVATTALTMERKQAELHEEHVQDVLKGMNDSDG